VKKRGGGGESKRLDAEDRNSRRYYGKRLHKQSLRGNGGIPEEGERTTFLLCEKKRRFEDLKNLVSGGGRWRGSENLY